MKKFILAVVNGEIEEWERILLLLAMGFCSGIFLSTYDIAATSLFLETFKENREEMLAFAMIGAGSLGIVSAVLIAYFQKRVAYKVLVTRFMALIALSVGILAFSLRFISPDSEVLVFCSSVIIGPSNAVVILLFWGMFGRIFSFRAAKRLAGGIDTGQAIATILGLFAIPLLEPVLPSIVDFLLISAVAITGVFLVTVAISRQFVFMESIQTAGEQQSAKKEEASLLKNKYAGIISLFVICSAMAASFADYTFLATAGDRFADQGELTRFLSFFGATVIIASFLIQTFLNDLIIEMFGLKISLLLLPIVLAFFTGAALVVAFMFGYTSDMAGDNFLIFFVVVSLSKLFVASLRDSLENPTVKLFFFPLDISIRFDIQTKVEGFISQSAGLIAGLIITALERFQFFDLIECQYIIFMIIGVWVFATIRMHTGYSTALSKTLLETKKSKKNVGENDHVIPKLLQKELQTTVGTDFTIAAKIAQKIDPLLLERYLCHFPSVDNDEKQAYMLQLIAKRRVFAAMPMLKDFTGRSMHQNHSLAKEVLSKLEAAQQAAQDFRNLKALATSEKPEDRQEACRLIPTNYSEETQQLLIPMLRDLDADVKRAAFLTVGKLRLDEFLPTLIDHMSVVGFENTSVSAILNYDEQAITSLDNAFYKNGQKQNAMINVVQMYGLIDGERATALLLRKTGFPDRRIVKEVLYSLNYSNWTATGAMTAFIKNHLEQAVGNTLWVLLASQEIKKNEDNKYLRRALEELTDHNYEEIFLLLSIIYDKQSVQLIEDNIKSGTPDSIGYAIELLNIVVDDELLPTLIPILDDSSVDDKLKKLEGTFLRGSFDSIEALRQIIIKDYNAIDKWTKVCAIHSYAMHPKTTITKDIVANLFNPDDLIQETAAWAICQEDKEKYDDYCLRLPEPKVKALNEIVLPAVLANDGGLKLSMEKVIFLYKIPIFEGVPGMVLSDLTEWMEEFTFEKGDFISTRGSLGHLQTIIIIEGHLADMDDTGLSEQNYFPYDVISDVLVVDGENIPERLTAMSEGRAYAILSERLYEIMGDHYALTERLLHNLQAQASHIAHGTQEAMP